MFDRRRPDPSQGVIETLLVADGRPVELEAHLERLQASLAELFSRRPTPDPREAIEARAAAIELGAVRVTAAPRGQGEMETKVELRRVHGGLSSLSGGNPAQQPVAARSLGLPGGLGPHKWADRSLLDDAQADLPPGTLPLILDADGAVLEASRANVFAVRAGALFTPPLDGRILPGVTRMRVLKIAASIGIDIREETLSRGDLLTADEVFLTGSVRGIEAAGSLDGKTLPGSGPVTGQLAAELRLAWLGTPVG